MYLLFRACVCVVTLQGCAGRQRSAQSLAQFRPQARWRNLHRLQRCTGLAWASGRTSYTLCRHSTRGHRKTPRRWSSLSRGDSPRLRQDLRRIAPTPQSILVLSFRLHRASRSIHAAGRRFASSQIRSRFFDTLHKAPPASLRADDPRGDSNPRRARGASVCAPGHKGIGLTGEWALRYVARWLVL